MKILIIRTYPSYVSVKNCTYNIQEVGLAKALVRKGHECDILFLADKKEENINISVENKGIVHVFYRQGKTGLKNLIYTNCSSLFAKYDILQPSEYNQIQSWILGNNYPNKTIVYHGPYYDHFNKRYNFMCKVFDILFLKQYITQETKFIVKSNLAKKFLTNKGIKESNISVIGVGIDIQMLSSKETECTEKIYLNMKKNSDVLKLLYIGRFEKRRNIFFVIDIFKKVLEHGTNAMLFMIGSGKHKYLKTVFKYIDKLGIREKIIWQEKIEQKYLSNIYQLADFLLLPTKYEIFGMVLLEAMYYRTIVLTTWNGGSSMLVQNGKNGFIIEDKNPDVWAKHITNIENNKIKMQQIQNNAVKTIKDYYTWDVLADKFTTEYAKFVGD